MAVKYACSKCEKRYIDWGAEKLGFKCPDCDGEELKLVGHEITATAKKKPSLKRKRKVKERVKVVKEAPPRSFEDEDEAMPAPGAVLADGHGSVTLETDELESQSPSGEVLVDNEAGEDESAAKKKSKG